MTLTWLGIVAAAGLAFSCWRSYRRGLIREVVSLLLVFFSMGVVWFINPYVNEFICENTSIYENVQENCRRFVEEKGNESFFVSGENQNTVINNMELPQLLTNGLLNNNTAEVYQYLAVTTFSDYIAQYLARMVVNGISFMISFVLATLLIRCITWMLNLISRLPIINGVNRLAGAFFGAAKYILVLWILFLVLTVLCNTQIVEQGLALIRKDYVLNYLYNKDVLIEIFMNVFYTA